MSKPNNTSPMGYITPGAFFLSFLFFYFLAMNGMIPLSLFIKLLLFLIVILPGAIITLKTYFSNDVEMKLEHHSCDMDDIGQLLHDYRMLVFQCDASVSKIFRDLSYSDKGYSLLRSWYWGGIVLTCFCLCIFEYSQLWLLDHSTQICDFFKPVRIRDLFSPAKIRDFFKSLRDFFKSHKIRDFFSFIRDFFKSLKIRDFFSSIRVFFKVLYHRYIRR